MCLVQVSVYVHGADWVGVIAGEQRQATACCDTSRCAPTWPEFRRKELEVILTGHCCYLEVTFPRRAPLISF